MTGGGMTRPEGGGHKSEDVGHSGYRGEDVGDNGAEADRLDDAMATEAAASRETYLAEEAEPARAGDAGGGEDGRGRGGEDGGGGSGGGSDGGSGGGGDGVNGGLRSAVKPRLSYGGIPEEAEELEGANPVRVLTNQNSPPPRRASDCLMTQNSPRVGRRRATMDSSPGRTSLVGPDRSCMPGHPPHSIPSFDELKNITSLLMS
jgi:hypothetical protein